jgi:hypothetical protein
VSFRDSTYVPVCLQKEYIVSLGKIRLHKKCANPALPALKKTSKGKSEAAERCSLFAVFGDINSHERASPDFRQPRDWYWCRCESFSVAKENNEGELDLESW